MTYRCEVIERTAQPTLTIRTHAAVQDLPQVFGQSYGAIMQYFGQIGQQPTGAPFVVYYNMDMQNLDMEIGFPAPGKLPGKGDVKASELPGGKAVVCLHVGPYDQIAAAYDALNGWLQASGLEGTGIAYEIYLNDPATTPPEALQTQIVMPLKGK